jgi:hypothetical protein
MTSKSMTLTAACLLVGTMFSWQAPAIAGSDNSSDTYAGNYTGGHFRQERLSYFSTQALLTPTPSSIRQETKSLTRTPMYGKSLRDSLISLSWAGIPSSSK